MSVVLGEMGLTLRPHGQQEVLRSHQGFPANGVLKLRHRRGTVRCLSMKFDGPSATASSCCLTLYPWKQTATSEGLVPFGDVPTPEAGGPG